MIELSLKNNFILMAKLKMDIKYFGAQKILSINI
jgi:hypothetical protein